VVEKVNTNHEDEAKMDKFEAKLVDLRREMGSIQDGDGDRPRSPELTQRSCEEPGDTPDLR
jgi:hypothetical protein